jgi:hypothetical protein
MELRIAHLDVRITSLKHLDRLHFGCGVWSDSDWLAGMRKRRVFSSTKQDMDSSLVHSSDTLADTAPGKHERLQRATF